MPEDIDVLELTMWDAEDAQPFRNHYDGLTRAARALSEDLGQMVVTYLFEIDNKCVTFCWGTIRLAQLQMEEVYGEPLLIVSTDFSPSDRLIFRAAFPEIKEMVFRPLHR